MNLQNIVEILIMVWVLDTCMTGCGSENNGNNGSSTSETKEEKGEDEKPTNSTETNTTEVIVNFQVEIIVNKYDIPDDAPPYLYINKDQDWDTAMAAPFGYELARHSRILMLAENGDLDDLLNVGDVLWTATEHADGEMAYAYGSGQSFYVMKLLKFSALYVVKKIETTTEVTQEETK